MVNLKCVVIFDKHRVDEEIVQQLIDVPDGGFLGMHKQHFENFTQMVFSTTEAEKLLAELRGEEYEPEEG